jgi:hypothetical protein
MWLKGIFAVIAAVTIILAMNLAPSPDVEDMVQKYAQYHLSAVGSSIYEYQAATGNWPTQSGDLARTSLPVRSPYWKYMLDDELIVVVWHKTLNPNPLGNADHILAYYNKGLISTQGQSWVCWGDLRTEYIKTEDLHKYLNGLKD